MRISRTVLWGHLPIKRSAIPELLADLSTWPTVDTSGFVELDRAVFESRAEAVRLFVEEREVTLAEIRRRTGVHPPPRQNGCRLFRSCISGFRNTHSGCGLWSLWSKVGAVVNA